ncbi:DedA family protein [Sulfodiicoccus acidiphilus]|uniref:DedA family protein n=1 Tax=Sulfodiicoccus acidiphilus TaxID=1670455 RepID=A0A348B0K8_9CREN|nr:DedA family protein [Sulfodiicoccus acidiphilus]BBD71710.1 DedA family protein [Sulfodiicoccus acidiphilus]GGT86439.1 DedA family protein [Sulfodiicoccus acidiphilus]
MDLISTLIQSLIGNYVGLFILMLLEGMSLPVPSEIVMPLAGAFSRDGFMSLWAVVAVGTMGSLLGSLVDYYIALYAGKAVIRRYGRFLHLNERRIDRVQSWFNKYGVAAVFFMKFVPGFRALISFPAGFGRMKIGKFTLATLGGHVIWDTVLASIGYVYASSWNMLIYLMDKYLNYIAIFLAAGLMMYFVFLLLRTRKGPLKD